ncbi:hypothetical protein EBESD8_49640 [Rhodococcus aetherivorans]|nr:hypothetical protein EBESD8_49640 [Rhodococcus aetherivorans]
MPETASVCAEARTRRRRCAGSREPCAVVVQKMTVGQRMTRAARPLTAEMFPE